MRRPWQARDPGDRLFRIHPRPGQLAGPKLQQPLRDAALRPVQAGQEDARLVADRVGNDRTVSQFEVEGRPDQLLGDFGAGRRIRTRRYPGIRLAARTTTGAQITDAEAARMNLRRVIPARQWCSCSFIGYSRREE